MPALVYEEYGTGSPVVCLHGFGASVHTWRQVLPSLTARHKVYALDLKGSGRSPKPRDGHYSVHDQAALVLRFITDHKLKNLTLVGHSFGGGVALAVAVELMKREPDTLVSLILLDAAAYPQRFPWFIRALRIPLLAPLAQHLLPTRYQVRSVLRLAYYNDRLIPEESVEAYAAPLRLPGGYYALRQMAKQMIPDDIDTLASRYPSIHVPTLLIWGRHDEIVPLWVGERLSRAIPGSRLVVIEDSGHVPNEETPAETRKAIDAFFLGNEP